MRARWRWFLALVLVADASVALFLLAGGIPTLAPAADSKGPSGAASPKAESAESAATAEALAKLGQELSARTAELDRKEAELDEILRGSEVLKRAGLGPETPVPAAAPKRPAGKAAAPATDDDNPFTRLKRAYENMEPESAAKALAELAERDPEAVVQMVVAWKPRTSGAILDALTQIKPTLAADLSYEIWRKSGKALPEPVDSDR